MKKRFTPNQRMIFVICFLSYSVAYMGRLNLSAALSQIAQSLHLTDAQCGLFQTAFAVTYAIGQVMNGSLVDRISAKRYIGVGLMASALCNALFGMCGSFWGLTVLWALNGAAQSMLWTPMVKLLTAWFHDERRERAAFGLSITIIIGHFAAWAVSGVLASLVNWRYAFFAPALMLAVMSTVAWGFIKECPSAAETAQDDDCPEKEPAKRSVTPMPMGKLLTTTGLAAILGCCVCVGFIRDGVLTWAPSILSGVNVGMQLNTTLLSLLIPLLNLVGVLAVKRFYRSLGGNTRRAAIALMLLCAALAFALLPGARIPVLCALLMGLCCATMDGINPLLTTIIPMEYENVGRVGLVAGLVDCFIYLGSALAGVATGALSDALNWNAVYMLWAVMALLGAGMLRLSRKREGKRPL